MTRVVAPYGSRLLGPADQSPRRLRVRVQLLLTALLVVTNVVGAGLVFLISAVVAPGPAPNHAMTLALAIGVPVYVAAAVVIGVVVGTVTTVRALRWVYDEEDPDEARRRRTLRAPLRLTALQFLLWSAGTALFTLLSALLQGERALTTGLTVGTATIVVSGVAYLLSDLALRPISARALAGASLGRRPRGVGIRARAIIFWTVGTGAPVASLVAAGIIALVDEQASATRLAVTMIVVGAVVLVFGLLVTFLASGAVSDPVLTLHEAMLDLEAGQLDREVVVFDGTEVGLLQAGFNKMAAGLRERERIRDLFGRHVGQQVAHQAADSLGDVELGGETREASVLFVDIEGSTAYAAEHSPTEVVEVLNRFFGVVVDEVDRHHGLVNKFIGDAVLAVFGAPVELEDHARAALETARAIAARLAEEVPELGSGVGVATGEVVAGNVGAQERFEYTVIGDVVNSASRLSDLAKETDGQVLAALATVEAAGGEEAGRWRADGSRTLRGRGEETDVAVPAVD